MIVHRRPFCGVPQGGLPSPPSPLFLRRERARSIPATAAPRMVAITDRYISRIPVATTTVWGIKATASQTVVKSR
jgi:hypothetical protein